MSLDPQHRWYLDKMGISTWVLREASEAVAEQQKVVVTVAEGAVEKLAQSEVSTVNLDVSPSSTSQANWYALEKNVDECVACSLHQTRSHVVFGVGDKHADCMLIGEAPGVDEDRLGEPFVGRAGKLLNNMLFAIGLRREQVFIANILKCRPTNNRDPRVDEIAACESFLGSQINLVKPKLIVALGRIAAHNLLKTEQTLSALRSSSNFYGESNIPVIVTYHPAYLLRSPREKRKSWQDLLLIRSLLNGA